jgi:hypothetical protein
MKFLLIIACALLLLSCGQDAQTPWYADAAPQDAAVDASSDFTIMAVMPPKRAALHWQIDTNCMDHGLPLVKFFDQVSGETYGPYFAVGTVNLALDCVEGHEICWGAWMGVGDYYDCSQADETGECYHVDWNSEYRSWGCGKNCDRGVSLWYCPRCDSSAPLKHIWLNCGG